MQNIHVALPGAVESPASCRPHELVELIRLDPALRLDVRYATAENFIGRAVYPEARVLLQRPGAEALVRINRRLKGLGYGLLIFDGYRPWSITQLFWELVSEKQRPYVADPAEGSRHNRGCAVDLTLYDLMTGREVTMPSAYDEMNERAHPDYAGGDPEPRRMRELLRTAMEADGFTVYPTEWWHFDYKDWREYALLDLPFHAIV
ncbi:M15 family metallopeptidase [Methylococcus sp. EFPC2]|uniref:M15 family metallopeptidase n=1 Tax=Methylococcus sp. EFPC2 TaxID=2812648 RepID=UPI00196747B5|nr:M15 family metallopeptidase [Methylococcus sp. EFPC2]QSA96939.1 M15 family metallopeptidase [Methylococcus sp. EFPC2]